MKEKFSEIGPIAYKQQSEAHFCGTDLLRQLEGKREERSGFSFCIGD